jgi:hypothetical protein
VTKFILKSHRQGEIWVRREEQFTEYAVCLLETWKGGLRFYAENQLDSIKKALVNFQQKDDTKAALELGMAYSSGQVCIIMMESQLILQLTLLTVLFWCPFFL